MSYAAVGALSQQQKGQIVGLLPRYYSLEFEQCWDDETNPDYPHCNELNTMYDQLSDEDADEMNDLITAEVPFYSEKEMMVHGAIVAGIAFFTGLVVGAVVVG